jgi:glycosyltransferase involved in cell wall biosynthesis
LSGTFSDARNFAIEKASYPWIFCADADDRLPPGQADNLIQLTSHLTPDCVYLFTIMNIIDGYAGMRFAQARLFENKPNLRFTHKVHESILESATAGMKKLVQVAEIVIHHTGYSLGNLMEKTERNYRILKTETNWPDAGYFIAGYHLMRQEFDEALSYLLPIWREQKASKKIWEKSVEMIGSIYDQLDMPFMAIQWYLKIEKTNSESWYKLAKLYERVEDTASAKEYYEKYFRSEEEIPLTGNMQHIFKRDAIQRLYALAKSDAETIEKEMKDYCREL